MKYGIDILGDFFGVSRHFQQYFSYILATSFSGGRSRSTRREPPSGPWESNRITCGCESSAPFFVIYEAGRPFKCNENNVTHVRTLYKSWLSLIILILVRKSYLFF